jgi:hypothetical protein
MESAEAYLVSDEEYNDWKADTYPNSLNDTAWDYAVQFAESYGIYPESDRPDDADPEDDDPYSDDIDGWWEEYDPKKHDGLKAGGGEWDWR